MSIKTSPVFLLLLFLASCTAPTPVQLRIRNTSAYIYDSILVNTSGGTNTYPTITPGTVSDYKTYDFAYSYAYVVAPQIVYNR